MIPYRSVHFIGVLTPEMASLAAYTIQNNGNVTASDDHRDSVYLPALIKFGITFYDMFAQLNVAQSTELVVLSRYYDVRHIEVDTATRYNIPIMSEVDYTKLISEGKRRVAILGDYQARFLAAALDHVWSEGHIPAQALTQVVPQDESVSLARSSDGADEFILPFSGFKRDAVTYEADFLALEAETVIIPAVSYDYPEINTTLDDVYQAYYAFVKRVPRRGLIIGNGDYSRMKRLRGHLADRHIEVYGFDRDVTWQIRDVTEADGKTTFYLLHNHDLHGPFTIPYVGKPFVYAAAAVSVVAFHHDMKPTTLGRGLATLPKYRRFFEMKIDKEGRIIIDDQADHPELISVILETVRACYPTKKIWCVYQPGSYLRTKALYGELQQALQVADFVYLTDIKGYPKEKSEGLNIRYFISEMKRNHPQTHYFDDATDMSGLLSDRVASTDCIVFLGAEGVCQQIEQSLLATQ